MSRVRTVTIGLASAALATSGMVAGGMATASASAHHGAAAAHHGVTVKSRHTSLGTFLVDAKGDTLYLFRKDGKNTSRCYHDCAVDWPPFLTKGHPVAAGKVKAGLLGTTKRKNGTKQVTYKGHPLYRFSEDTAPGQMNGEGLHEFGGEWVVVGVNGKGIDSD